ncbi:MAG: hypothetical protein U0570_11925 [Phycisphaerales bacterium]
MNRDSGVTKAETDTLLNSDGRKPARKGRRVLFVVLGVLLLLVGTVMLLPKLASPFIRGKTVFMNDDIQAKVDSASLAWFGGQAVTIQLQDAQGNPAGTIRASLDRGLLGLVTNWYNLGTIRITGDAELRQGLKAASAPSPAAPSSGNQATVAVQTNRIPIPRDLAARIEIDLTKVSVIDTSRQPIAELRDVKSVADVRFGSPITLQFDAKSGASPISARVKIDQWTGPDGAVHLDSVTLAKNSPKVDASVNVEALSVALVDALVAAATGQNQQLQKILGDTLTVQASANGDFNGGSASLALRAPQAKADVKLALKDGVLSLPEPTSARVDSPGMAAVLQRFLPPGASGGLAIRTAPSATVQVDTLSMKLPTSTPDLRGARVQAKVTIENTDATLTLAENQPPAAVSIPTLRAALSSDDLAGSLRLTADSSSSITSGGQTSSGGTLAVDMIASGLLDSNGAPVSGLPKSINGKVSLKGASTGILQPFVAGALANSGLSVDLPQDFGPTADVELVARTEGGANDIDLTVAAASAQMSAALRVTEGELVTREAGASVRLASAGRLAARALKSDLIQFTRPSGVLYAKLSSLRLPLETGTRKPRLDQLSAEATAELSDWSLAAALPAGANQTPGRPVALELTSLQADLSVAPGTGANVKVAASPSINGAPVQLQSDVQTRPLFTPTGAMASGGLNALASATMEVNGIPSSVAEILPRSGDSNVGALVREVVGDAMNLSAELKPDAKTANAGAFQARLESPRLKFATSGRLEPASLHFGLDGSGTLAPTLLESLGGAGADKPRLRAPVAFTLKSETVTIPLDAKGSPDFAKAGVLKSRLTVPGQAIVQSGAQAYGVQDFAVDSSFPLAALAPANGQGEAAVVATGGLLSADGTGMGKLEARVNAPLAAGMLLNGPALVELKINDLNTVGVDRAINQPGLVSGALGPAANLTATTRIAPPGGKPTVLGEAIGAADIAADLTLSSQHLEIKRPLHAKAQGDRISLEAAEPLLWTIEPAWFDRFVLGKGQGGKDSDLSLASPTRVELVLTRAVAARTNPDKGVQGPAYPGIFALDATARIPSMELVDTRSVRTQMGDGVLKLQSGSGSPVTIAFDLSFAKLAIVPDLSKAPPGGGGLKGSISNIASPSGVVDASNAVLTAKGQIQSIPSALVDAFSVRNGLPGEILGPSITVGLDAQNFSKAGGTIAFAAVSTETGNVTENGATVKKPRAEMSLQGVAQNGVLVAPLNIIIRRVDLGLQKRLSEVMPLVADVEKRYEDKQTVISSKQVAIPLDGDVRKLNGVLNVEPGDARFKVSGPFSAILRAVKAREEGKLLQRLKPLDLTFTNGVMTYPRWAFPIGEFNVEMEGTVDLPQSRMDLITWIPFGQLADDTAKLFSRIPGVGTAGNVINQTTMVPFRTSGPLGNTRTSPDLELFGKNFLKNVNPEKVVDVIKDIFKKPK